VSTITYIVMHPLYSLICEPIRFFLIKCFMKVLFKNPLVFCCLQYFNCLSIFYLNRLCTCQHQSPYHILFSVQCIRMKNTFYSVHRIGFFVLYRFIESSSTKSSTSIFLISITPSLAEIKLQSIIK